ncbi:MAG TPA: hypothetical protein VM509_00485, partial [Planctomycetota bacterium]|nr:hypothetical protein [Planctomycetota bacterium]
MITPWILCLLSASAHASLPVAESVFAGEASVAESSLADDPTFETKLAAAGKDVAKLLELANACVAAKQEAEAKKAFRKVVEIDAANEEAHKGLGHQFYDKKWFESFAELAKYKREEAAKMKAKGLVRFKDEWVSEADLPFLNMAWIKNDKGEWTNPIDAVRAKEISDHLAAKDRWRPDDSSWVAPAELGQWSAQLWKCGSEWLDTAKANEFHAKLETPWKLEGEHFRAWTTCEWEAGNLARWNAEKCYPELVRIFGIEPKGRPYFVVLNSLAQYNQAAGAQPPLFPDVEGFSSLHGAYFADQTFDTTLQPPQYAGAGVSFWDRKDAKLKEWGPYWLRWAAGQSFVDAIDPSWSFIGDVVTSAAGGGPRPDGNEFWTQKKIPRWLRYGAASYVERYMKNPQAAEGQDPWDLRTFAFAELKKGGGL